MSAIDAYLARPWLAHYQEGVPRQVEVPLKSVAQAFDEATERAPERPGARLRASERLSARGMALIDLDGELSEARALDVSLAHDHAASGGFPVRRGCCATRIRHWSRH